CGLLIAFHSLVQHKWINVQPASVAFRAHDLVEKKMRFFVFLLIAAVVMPMVVNGDRRERSVVKYLNKLLFWQEFKCVLDCAITEANKIECKGGAVTIACLGKKMRFFVFLLIVAVVMSMQQFYYSLACHNIDFLIRDGKDCIENCGLRSWEQKVCGEIIKDICANIIKNKRRIFVLIYKK
ncbi:hypothetical protein Bhyg_02930, partial [Pseudolycoriella hygida]